jgi:hypothetical protein
MEVQIYFLIGSIFILCLTIFLAIAQHKGWLLIPSFKITRVKTGKIEKRIFSRHNTSLKIRYKVSSGEEGVSYVKDIGRGGIRLFLNNPFRIGTLLNIEIKLPFDITPILAKGSVVWTDEDESDAGISFDEVRQQDLNRIMQYIGNRKEMLTEK